MTFEQFFDKTGYLEGSLQYYELRECWQAATIAAMERAAKVVDGNYGWVGKGAEAGIYYDSLADAVLFELDAMVAPK